MKIILPENQSEITLDQYQKYVELCEREDLDIYTFNRRKITIFTDLNFHDTDKITQLDFEFCLSQIDKALNEEVEFQNRFNLNGYDFGFVTNFDKLTNEEQNALDNISLGEFIDAEKYISDVTELHKIVAVLFRPIIKEDSFKNYAIADYNGTKEWSEYMKKTPLNIVNGMLFFFINLSTELETFILKSTMEAQARERLVQATFKSGGGIQPSLN